MYNRVGIIASSLFAFFLAYTIPSVINIWYTVGTLIIPALLISVISSYFEKLQVHSKYILASMIGSFSVSLIFFLLGIIYKVDGKDSLLFGLEPIYPGLITGLIIYLYGYNQRKFLKIESEQ